MYTFWRFIQLLSEVYLGFFPGTRYNPQKTSVQVAVVRTVGQFPPGYITGAACSLSGMFRSLVPLVLDSKARGSFRAHLELHFRTSSSGPLQFYLCYKCIRSQWFEVSFHIKVICSTVWIHTLCSYPHWLLVPPFLCTSEPSLICYPLRWLSYHRGECRIYWCGPLLLSFHKSLSQGQQRQESPKCKKINKKLNILWY